MMEQSYATHRRFVKMYHIFTFLLILILFVSSVYYTISAAGKGISLKPGLFILLISIIFISLFYYARSFALKAQDRAIRAEENFRHYLLTGKPLDSRLTTRQIIGLRFAADEEFIELSKVAAETGLKEEDIKKKINNWKPDLYRV